MVELDQVSFGYGRDRLFTDTTLKLAPGNIYGLLGLNGAGKSTLLQLMSGLLFVGKGRITAGGYNPAERTPGYFSRKTLTFPA